jgi:DNA-binding SARP family transcriptional activator/tetratricopeptide (TPR) repeat protein
MTTGMEFCLLGPLVVRSGGLDVPVAQAKQRAVLAALLLDANRLVSVDRLSATLWGSQQPPSAPATVRNLVRRLRDALGDAGRERIGTRPGGYLITVEDGELDVSRFGVLLDAAHGAAGNAEWDRARSLAGEALALWRGEPLADVPSQLLDQREAPQLREMRLQAEEVRIDASLRLGYHARVTAELERLAIQHPLREHLHALLMLALYRGGRQADALAAYQRVRTTLVEEIGAEPGPELRALHQRVLAGDSSLDAPLPAQAPDQPPTLPRDQPAEPRKAPGTAPDTAAGAAPDTAAGAAPDKAAGAAPDTAAGTAPETAARKARGGTRRTPAVPRQLPGAVRQFVGREPELAALTRLVERPGRATPDPTRGSTIAAISGTAGVGKTALAVHWGHQVTSLFPDGQLWVDLRGYDPAATPLPPAEAIRVLLDALHVPPDQVPASLDAQTGLYRSLLAGKRILVVLDNGRDAGQIRPLLPGTPGCPVVVTSRSRLLGLAATEQTIQLDLDVLSLPDAHALLAARLGKARLAAEPAAVDELVRLCGGLPLALGIAAARAQLTPHLRLAELANHLQDTHTRLDVLDTGDPGSSLRAAFACSYQQLSADTARAFRLLGLHPGPDITTPAAASLTGQSPQHTQRNLNQLVEAHLLTEGQSGRYTQHDLLRWYAQEQADQRETTTCRQRLLDHYQQTAHTAMSLITNGRHDLAVPPPGPGVHPEEIPGSEQAFAWFDAEKQVLLAVLNRADETAAAGQVWRLAAAMATWLNWRDRIRESLEVLAIGLPAAQAAGDRAGLGHIHLRFGRPLMRLKSFAEGETHLRQALTEFGVVGDFHGQAMAEQALCVLFELRRDYRQALRHSTRAQEMYRKAGDERGLSGALNGTGWLHMQLGEYADGLAYCQEALAMMTKLRFRAAEGETWDSIAYAYHHLGQYSRSLTCYRRAVSLARELGKSYYVAESLMHMGDTHHAAGDHRAAEQAWHEALSILVDLEHPDAELVAKKLAALPARLAAHSPS